MTYSLARDSLVSALETCSPITSKKHVNTAFSRVRVALNHELRFTATDAVVTVCGARSLSKTGPGLEASFDCAALLEATRRMPEGDVTLKLKDQFLEMKSGKRSYKAVYLDADTLPAALEKPRGRFAIVPGGALVAAINRVRWAMSDEQRAYDGVRVALRDRQLCAQTMHNHHVAEAIVAVESQAETVDIVVPPGLVASLVAACGTGDVGVLDDGSALWLDTPAGLFRYLSAVERGFSQEIVNRVLSGSGPTITTPTEPLIEAVKYVSLAAERQAPRMHLEARDRTVSLSAIDGQREATDSIEAEISEQLRFAISPRHFVDALTAAGENCTITVPGERDPVLIRGDGFRCCVMPLQPRCA